jgi:diguanylate cyclase (GGDEF)-like protein
MYDSKADGLTGGTEYIQILARQASIVFAAFSGLATWYLGSSAWQWVAGLASAYALYGLFICRRPQTPGLGELFISLLFCAALTFVRAEYCAVLYQLLLIRLALRVGRKRAARVAMIIAAVYLAATFAGPGSFAPAALASVAYNLMTMALITTAAVRLDGMTSKQASGDQQMLELIRQNDRNYRMALTDGLTGLYNHRAYKERIDSLSQYVLFIIDIDHFKRLNDANGHLIGDKVLAGIGNIIKLSIRSGDLAFRYGGEEFVVVLPGTTAAVGQKIAERLRLKVAEWNFEDTNGRIPVTVSIGMAIKKPGVSSQAVFEQADRALYRAKQTGRNNVQAAIKTGPDAAVRYGM